MNQQLQSILSIIEQDESLTAEEKGTISKLLKEVDKELEITTFKLDRTEKVKRTTAILLEETIEELEKKRKAIEAQNRELEIESSLERVRTQAMSMKQPSDMVDICRIISEQLESLNVNDIRNIQTAIINESKGIYQNYEYYPQYKTKSISELEINLHPRVVEFVNEIQKASDAFFTTSFEGDALKDWREFRQKTNQAQDPKLDEATAVHYYFYSIGPGALGVSTYAPLNEEDINVFKRFRNVFDLAYRRFIDIELAEAQAKEAKIELSLERVRARTMAMQRSEELSETAAVLFQQFKELGEAPDIATIGIINEADWVIEFWVTEIGSGNKTDRLVRATIDEPTTMHKLYVAWKQQQKSLLIDLTGKDLSDYIHFRSNAWEAPLNQSHLQGHRYINAAFFSKGVITISTHEPRTQQTVNLLERFAGVFDLTYTRFFDLKQAEAQAKEAKIEAALEKVRGTAMAMHNSNDLSATASMVFTELRKLGINPIRSGVGLLSKDSRKGLIYTATTSSESDALALAGPLDMSAHPCLEMQYEAWLKKEIYFPVLSGVELKSYYKVLSTQLSVHSLPAEKVQHEEYGYYLPFSEGSFYVWTEKPYSENEINILNRFKAIIDLTFRRYLDLQKAEAQAREAQIEVALERVRSRTLAMQNSDELAETAAVVFKQLINLGIVPNRLYIGIIQDDSGNIELWATEEDGSKISTRFTGNINKSPTMAEMYKGWKEQKKSITIDLQGKELSDYIHYLTKELHAPVTIGHTQKRRVQSIAYFSKGFIGIASPDPQPEETTNLLERFAGVFNLTFTRFNDLKIAEAHALQAEEDLIKLQTEKKRAEDALTELQATQKQLIQSEKMASLGELTAGIAHEIQNPLNFVNNFSEVNAELIEEMKQEIDKENLLEIRVIANDIKDNQEKITYHGKRADAIVKGMLQHSRSSSGVKEPTDINALADEYLRLAYHGLRAKDKSFNATMKTDFDESIGFINIIPQDIGRVILNLITNAFYAVTEKKKNFALTPYPLKGGAEYEPTVSVSTKLKLPLSGGRGSEGAGGGGPIVEIRVTDNGNGIPQKVLDKIFQPFFTTKPVGQGTGLGLSISYDIIRVHGGEMKVETKEGEGSEFIVTLPL